MRKFFFICVLFIFGFTGGVFFARRSNTAASRSTEPYGEELAYITQENRSFDELKVFFAKITYAKGAQFAYEVLKSAPLAPTVSTHVLGHVIGDILWKVEGEQGIAYCTAHFRNACSHSIVGALLFGSGEKALARVAQICQKSAGGSFAYEQCYHGIGHGLLSAVFYDIPKGISLCKGISLPGHDNRDFGECVGGMMMELATGGGHDMAFHLKASKKYFKTDDPLYPCSGSIVPNEVRSMCYEYYVFHFFEIVGGDLHNPSEKDFDKVMAVCRRIPSGDQDSRSGCFGGLGRILMNYHQGEGTLRTPAEIANHFQDVHTWCDLAGSQEGTDACNGYAVRTLYWNGERVNAKAVTFCSLSKTVQQKSSCFKHLISAALPFYGSIEDTQLFCDGLPREYTKGCPI